MSGTSGTQSTKGETTSSKSSKSGYDHLDINKLYKGKSTEPVAKTVTQKHGMQALGKALPARRGGTTAVKSESTHSDVANSSAPTQPTSLPPNIGQTPLHPPGWSNTNLPHPQGPPSPHNAPNVPTTGPPMHDKNWSGGPDRKGNFQSAAAQDSMQRFAQEFPSLDSGGDTGKGSNANASGPSSQPGHPQMSKSNQDNQYGPGPILRPQTEGSWTQGGGRGMPRPPGPPPPSGAPTRDFGPERPNLGGPTPPPMLVGQGGHPPPPPLGFPMQFPPRPPYMYPPNAGPGPGNFYPGPRYGMPMPGVPPPPTGHPPDGPPGPREPGRGGRGPPPHPQMRPASHFTSKPIIKQEELERMDELGAQDGGWATVQDDIDYNKKISFSDDEGEDKGNENSARGGQPKNDRGTPRQDPDKRERDDDREMRRSIKILERQQQPPALNERNEREPLRDRDSRFEPDREREPPSARYDYENEDDWKRKPAPGFEQKERGGDRERGPGRGGRMREEESWRSVSNNRFDEDPRAKKGPAPPVARMDPRGPPDFAKQFPSNLPPRLQRQQHQQPPIFTQSTNQRKTPSPVPTSGSGNASAVNKERGEFREREWERDRGERDNRDRPAYKILERNRGDSESSKDSTRDLRDRRFGNSNDSDRLRDKPDSTKRLSSDSGRGKDDDDTKASPKDKGETEESSRKQQEESKLLFRSKPPFSTSWADEVDDEEYNMRDEEDSRKGLRDSITSHMKRDQIYPEERRPRETTVPRRVIIQQTKVENMRSDVKPEPVPEPKPEPVKIEKPVEKVKSSAWGDRDSMREMKAKADDPTQKDSSQMKESERDSHSAEKEAPPHKKPESGDFKSEMGKDPENDKSHHHGGLERKGSKEKIDRERHYDRYGRYDDRRQQQDKDRSDNRNNNLRDNRQKPRRMDSYESKRDNRTPDRDQYSNVNRNNSNDNMGSSGVSRNSQEKDNRDQQDKSKAPGIEKSKSGDRLDSLKENKLSDKADKDDFKREKDQDKDYDRPIRSDRDDYDNSRDGRGHRGGDRGDRGGRGKERGGYGGVYQPRGGNHWSSEPKGRRGGRGNPRDFYDKPRRMDMDKEDKPYGKDELSRQSESDKDKSQDKLSDLSNKGSAEDLGGKKKDKDQGGQGSGPDKKQNKNQTSPGAARRNARGGARLQGYGPPSDKNPFSTNQSHKDEDPSREKSSGDTQISSKPGPVPLMALGDISPPNLQSKSRHHGSGRDGTGGREVGGGGRGGRGMPPRMQRDDYSFRDSRGGGGNKRGGGRSGDAKPLMSINSNEVEVNDWESESESGDDESKRSQHSRKDGGHHHHTTSQSSQDALQQQQQHGAASDNLAENADADLQKKNNMSAPPKQSSQDKSNLSSRSDPPKGPRQDRERQDRDRQEVKPPNKDRRIKNPPYDPRPNSRQQSQSSVGNIGTWEKTMPSTQQLKEMNAPQQQQQQGSHSNTSTPALDNKEVQDSKPASSTTTTVHPSASVSVSNASILDTAGSGPLKTMIFENTNFKSISNNSAKVVKPVEPKKETGLNMDLGKDLQLGFGKAVCEEAPEISFSSFSDNTTAPPNVTQPQQSVQSQPSSKTMPIGQSRSYVSHQPSPISPQAADLNEKVQSVKRIWEMPTMPSVAEQNSVCGSEDNSFHGGFGSDSFKGPDSSGREFGSSLQQPTSGYAPGSSPALAAISKPESSSSPTSSNLRMSKAQQQSSLDNQGQSGISSSPFGYTMAQPQGSNAFSSMPAVPSPPSVMYGTSQTLHAAGPPSGMYQTFPHVDAPQVMGATGRGQYQQYPTHNAATSGHYGLFLSTPMEYQSMSSYQHQQGNQGPQAQAQSQSTRISPGPMTTSGGNSTGVIISSANSLMSMKQQSQTGSHHHQVVPGTQQGYSQLSHHHPAAALPHPQHHLGAVGPAKGGYSHSQSGIATPSQQPVFIPFDPSQQSVINIGQSFLSSAMRSGPPGGPPPPATPPVQALQASSSYYSGSSGNQSAVYPTGSNQGGSLQQLHVAVAPNPQGLPGLHSGNPQYGIQYPTQLNLQGFNQQAAASTVSALNLSNQLIRNPAPGSHSYMKQPGLDLVQQAQMKNTHDPNMMNQNTWNSAGSWNQSFHANKSGGSQDRNAGNNIGNQRKGNSHAGNIGNMKYMSNQGPGGYSGQVQ